MGVRRGGANTKNRGVQYRGNIGFILGLYGDNGKQHGNYYRIDYSIKYWNKKPDPITDPPILIVWYTSKLYSND